MLDYNDEYIQRLEAAVDEGNNDVVRKCSEELYEHIRKLPLNQKDSYLNLGLCIFSKNLTLSSTIRASEVFRCMAIRIMPLMQFFYAMYPEGKKIKEYNLKYNQIAENIDSPDIGITINAFILEYGLASLPDILLLAADNRNTAIYNLVQMNLRHTWDCSFDAKFEGVDNEHDYMCLYKLSMGYLKEAFEEYGIRPKFLADASSTNMNEMVENDIKMIVESSTEDNLEDRLSEYQEAYLDTAGIYHIMANMMQEAAYSIDSYLWFSDMFESEYERCEREDKYLQMCEAQYRATGKRPRYISNTYDLDDEEPKKKSNDDWINPPQPEDDKPDKKDDDLDDIPKKKNKPFDFDNDDKEKKTDGGAKNIYNITYQNSFNRNKRMTVKDSWNRTNSDDIYSDHRHDSDDEEDYGSSTMAKWRSRSKIQKKIVDTFKSKESLPSPPDDTKESYLKDIMWTRENIKNTAPWVIMRDTQLNRPHNDIGYRKYLATKIEKMAMDRDIEYDGDIIVAGDPIDGIYDIELNRYNEKHVIESLRKVANAVLAVEIETHMKSSKPKSENKTLAEAIDILNQMHEFEEAIKGGDPTKDRPLGQRIYNRVEDFNVKAQQKAADVDRGMRTVGEIGSAVMRTPATFIRTVKNFISDMQNRGEQNLKEDILKDKKLRMRIFGFMRSLIKTGIPWVVLGPIWGTLFNIIALPIRAIKGTITAIQGGPHRDVMIELREELRIELDIIQDMINKAEAAGDQQKKYKLMREKSRMEQEYFKIASKVHFDPIANKRARRGDISY